MLQDYQRLRPDLAEPDCGWAFSLKLPSAHAADKFWNAMQRNQKPVLRAVVDGVDAIDAIDAAKGMANAAIARNHRREGHNQRDDRKRSIAVGGAMADFESPPRPTQAWMEWPPPDVQQDDHEQWSEEAVAEIDDENDDREIQRLAVLFRGKRVLERHFDHWITQCDWWVNGCECRHERNTEASLHAVAHCMMMRCVRAWASWVACHSLSRLQLLQLLHSPDSDSDGDGGPEIPQTPASAKRDYVAWLRRRQGAILSPQEEVSARLGDTAAAAEWVTPRPLRPPGSPPVHRSARSVARVLALPDRAEPEPEPEANPSQPEPELDLTEVEADRGRAITRSKQVVATAVVQHGWSLRYTSNALREDLTVVLGSVKQDGLALEWASAKLRADPQVVLAAVAQNGSALQFASEELRANRATVLAAVAQDGCALQFATAELQADAEVLVAANMYV